MYVQDPFVMPLSKIKALECCIFSWNAGADGSMEMTKKAVNVTKRCFWAAFGAVEIW